MKKTIQQTVTRTVEVCDVPGCNKEAVFAWPCFACGRALCLEHGDYFVAVTWGDSPSSRRLCADCSSLYPGGLEALRRDLGHIRDATKKAIQAEQDRGVKLMADVFAGIKAARQASAGEEGHN